MSITALHQTAAGTDAARPRVSAVVRGAADKAAHLKG